jgi:hypothetical protein
MQRMLQYADDLVTGQRELRVPLNIVVMDGILGFPYPTSKYVPPIAYALLTRLQSRHIVCSDV